MISAGSLVGNTASLQGDVVDNATLIFDQATDDTFAGTVSGTGSVIKQGTGALTLVAPNTYSGGTTVASGSLIGTTASLQGDIVNNAVLVFDQAGDGTYAGNVSGSGALIKQGAGALTLQGGNSYLGGTTINAGTLIGNTASLQGDITNNSTLTFLQNSAGTYSGRLFGFGRFIKLGNGTLVLTANSGSFTGPTEVNAGTLSVGNQANPARRWADRSRWARAARSPAAAALAAWCPRARSSSVAPVAPSASAVMPRLHQARRCRWRPARAVW